MNQVRDGLLLTFESLHYGIAERDMALLSDICEPNLRTAFADFFDDLDEENC